MKKLKTASGYETVLAAECSVSGCKAILDADAPAAVKKYAARYADRGRNLLFMALMTGLILKSFYSVTIASFAQTGSGAETYDMLPETRETEDSLPEYREYAAAFEAAYPREEIRIGVEDCVRYEENGQAAGPVVYKDYEGMEGESIYTAADGMAEFAVHVEEEGFYQLSLAYYPAAGSDAAIERRILIDGAVPYRELSRVRYDRIWEVSPDRRQEASGAGVPSVRQETEPEPGRGALSDMTEKTAWITASSRDGSGRTAEPLGVYLTKGEHTISFLSLREPMLIHQIILGCARPVQEYRQVKGFWDAVGIRAAGGQPVCIEAEQMGSASTKEISVTKERFLRCAFPMSVSAKGFSDYIGSMDGSRKGIFWEQAGQWVEWEFNVEKAGYYHISMGVCQNYAKETDSCRKILIDGAVPFREMERYGFAYGWGWRKEVLGDETGTPYVFYLKEGRHTIRLEAVSGDGAEAGRGQPLAVDRIDIVPADR